MRCAASCLFVSFALSTSVCAQVSLEEFLSPVNAQGQLDLLSDDIQASFYHALESFDRQISERPYDVVLRVQRCRFIDDFSYQYEYEVWIDTVYELGEACGAELETDWGNHPEVILRGFEYLYGEGLLEAAVPYDYPANRPGWTEGQLSRLYEMLAIAADAAGDPNAGAYALRAVELDEGTSVRVIAAESLAADDMPERAMEILSSPFAQSNLNDEPWNATREMTLLATMGERDRVIELYRQLKRNADYYDAGQVARALRDVGELALAHSEFASAAEVRAYGSYSLYEWFNFELAFGTGENAMSAYERWRATGWRADPLGINRVALFLKDRSQPLKPRDLFGVLGVAVALLTLSFAALVAVVPVHYRGAVRRARQELTLDTSGWRLRHAWYALFAMGVASLVSLYGTGAIDIAPVSQSDWLAFEQADQLGRSIVLSGLAFLVLIVPLCRVRDTANEARGTASWSIPKCVLIALGVALAFRIPFFLVRFVAPDSIAELVSSSFVWEAVANVREQYGVFVALLIVSAVAPVTEEIVFRGVLLRSFVKNISFGWANTIQAGVFALMHMELSATPLLFAFGLVAGVLARRSGGLLAPILLHAAFNFIVGAFVLIPG